MVCANFCQSSTSSRTAESFFITLWAWSRSFQNPGASDSACNWFNSSVLAGKSKTHQKFLGLFLTLHQTVDDILHTKLHFFLTGMVVGYNGSLITTGQDLQDKNLDRFT
jgi:hypothetical protein